VRYYYLFNQGFGRVCHNVNNFSGDYMYTLYIANKLYSSWSLRPWVLMIEKSIPFTEKIVPLAEGSSWEKYRSFAPNGRVPCLHDGEIIVWDSLSIVEYLAERHPGIWPTDSIARAWSRSAAAEMHSGFSNLRQQCSMHCSMRIQLPEISASLQKDLDRLDELWNDGLHRFGGDFLGGDTFTAVDAFFAPIAIRIQTYGLPLSEKSMAYSQRLLALDSMQSWVTAGIQEPWTEINHEQEVLQSGTLLADYR
jgi:glutathione S-transferase